MLTHLAHHDLHHFLPLLTDPAPGGGGDVIPDPPAALPAGLGPSASKLVSWAKGACDVIAVLSLLMCAGMMMAGRRRRGELAVEGAIGGGWVIAGLALVGGAAMLVRSIAL
jgi:hypothetical protein